MSYLKQLCPFSAAATKNTTAIALTMSFFPAFGASAQLPCPEF
jgi:hypothetical protein